MNIKDFASESGHWYAKDGTPAYTIVGKNGKERPTTLRDARTLELVPSVTTILSVLAKPGLENWKQNQILMAALTMPRVEGETEQEYIARIIRDSKEQGMKAAEEGTRIHGAIESFYTKKTNHPDYDVYVSATVNAVYEKFGEQEWIAEKSFATSAFGGKVDLASPEVVLDFKSKEFTEDDLPKPYDENVIQLAAYRHGLAKPYTFPTTRCANVFISRNVPGLVHIVEHDQEEIERGWRMFSYLLALWMQLKRFNQ
jgi:hypothetical protein